MILGSYDVEERHKIQLQGNNPLQSLLDRAYGARPFFPERTTRQVRIARKIFTVGGCHVPSGAVWQLVTDVRSV